MGTGGTSTLVGHFMLVGTGGTSTLVGHFMFVGTGGPRDIEIVRAFFKLFLFGFCKQRWVLL